MALTSLRKQAPSVPEVPWIDRRPEIIPIFVTIESQQNVTVPRKYTHNPS